MNELIIWYQGSSQGTTLKKTREEVFQILTPFFNRPGIENLWTDLEEAFGDPRRAFPEDKILYFIEIIATNIIFEIGYRKTLRKILRLESKKCKKIINKAQELLKAIGRAKVPAKEILRYFPPDERMLYAFKKKLEEFLAYPRKGQEWSEYRFPRGHPSAEEDRLTQSIVRGYQLIFGSPVSKYRSSPLYGVVGIVRAFLGYKGYKEPKKTVDKFIDQVNRNPMTIGEVIDLANKNPMTTGEAIDQLKDHVSREPLPGRAASQSNRRCLLFRPGRGAGEA